MSATTDAIVRGFSFGYRDRGGVLQQTRATLVVAWCATLGLIVVLYENPLVLAATFAATLTIAHRCRVLGEVLFAVVLAAPLAALTAVINPIASQQGLTVLVAGIDLPVLGVIDITQEALVYGQILALRGVTVFAICALYVNTVDPDELLRVLRRFSVRSAITASLAVRFVPVLARDGLRLSEARECRPGKKPGARAIVRAMFARSLDRAGDSALALETRGYALAGPLRLDRRRWRAADRAVALSALALFGLMIAGRVAGLAGFEDYPLTVIETGPQDAGFALLIAAAAAVPPWLIGQRDSAAGGGNRRARR
ncbi:MAG: energy-coupling factor transporter transmembrane component T [Solirubrobacterales bacterium]